MKNNIKLQVYNINDIKHMKILRSKCYDVIQFNDQLKNIVDIMIKTNIMYNSIGIAAPQIGILKNIIVIDRFPKQALADFISMPLVLINPTFKALSFEEEINIEGCLSIPKKTYMVKRFKTIFVTAYDINGNKINFNANNLLSRCIQHQIDHLHSKLICDIGKQFKN